MNNDLDKVKVCIICEGDEEYHYLSKLINIAVFSPKYIIKLINAKGIGNIFSRYQMRYSSDSFHIVLIFCDTDKYPYKQYLSLKDKINKFHATNIADKIVYYGNPCTMQIILSHLSKVKLKSPAKKENAIIIENLTSIPNYSANESQVKELMRHIKRSNYETLKRNLKELSQDDTIKPSSNFISLLTNLENEDNSWIDKINSKIN